MSPHGSVHRCPCTGGCPWGAGASASCSKGGSCARVWKFHRGGLNQGGLHKCGFGFSSPHGCFFAQRQGFGSLGITLDSVPEGILAYRPEGWNPRGALLDSKGFSCRWCHAIDSPGISWGHQKKNSRWLLYSFLQFILNLYRPPTRQQLLCSSLY